MQKDPLVWHEPLKFIPERFDLQSPYYKTPSGESRSELSFMPFFSGIRSCPAEGVVYKGALYAAAMFIQSYEFKPCDASQPLLPNVKIGYHNFHEAIMSRRKKQTK